MKHRNNLIHEAISFATLKHAEQKRKGSGLPYITHPMEVMQILSANGCSEKVIIAGILHDTLEDTKTTHDEIRELFGDDILKIVCAESEDKSKTWKERKQTTINNLDNCSLEEKSVCLADKLANLRSTVSDVKTIGEDLWNRFKAPKDDIEWYYRNVFAKLSELSGTKMYAEYRELLGVVFG